MAVDGWFSANKQRQPTLTALLLWALCIKWGTEFMSKQIVMATWVITISSLLWLLSKAKPECLFFDWLNYLTILVVGIFAGNALSKMHSTHKSKPQWAALMKLILPFYVGVACIICGVLFSATNFLGSQWPGFFLAIFGIVFYQIVLTKADFFYRQL
ncbi:hypothetical protein M2404_001621 [Rheinheimera pacifica]|uniref:hypothetical protein n=1 Tax=Rheinheimera pacifica TaxID=173990 RepID=UPI00216A3F63|nr:hypothetical protein [Rheinheimera pacifica]MCS4307294.1 hypothetical protein [Rheinheimera pacifica]